MNKRVILILLVFIISLSIVGCNNSDSLKLDGVRDDFAKEMKEIYNELEEVSKTDKPSEIINDEYNRNYADVFYKYFDDGNDKETIVLAEIGTMIMHLKNNKVDRYEQTKSLLIEELKMIDEEN